MIKYTLDTVKSRVLNKGYVWFEEGDFNVNIVSFRNPSTGHKVTNQFDDTLTISYKENSLWYFYQFPVTVDPGKSSMLDPENKNGCAILVPNQYRGCYEVDKHKGQYDALCQKDTKEVCVYRDNTKDMVYNLDDLKIFCGIFGINIHASNPKTESYFVDGWSAGCTVFKRKKDFNSFMVVIKKARELYGNSFTYTLF